jgi:hypothetical protein
MPTPDEIRTRIFLNAALPLTKVVREDDKIMRLITKNMTGVIQFMVKGTETGAHMIFENDTLEVTQGIHKTPNVTFVFKSNVQLNDFFMGKLALPGIKGLFRRPDLVIRTVPLLLALKMLMPEANPKDPKKRALKVKLLMYMVTVALSQLNKCGEESMVKMVKKSPDRVYQWLVEGGGPSAYLRMKAGKTKAGKGQYKRRRPFVLMRFPNIEGAYQVLTSAVPLVEAVKEGHVVPEGAMEYSKEIGLHMQFIEELMQP